MELFVLCAGLLQFPWVLRSLALNAAALWSLSLIRALPWFTLDIQFCCGCWHVQRYHMLFLFPDNLLSSRLNAQ